jgi:hypothetical protein
MDEHALQKFREEFIRLETNYNKEIPELKKKQEVMLGDIQELQTDKRDQKIIMQEIAQETVTAYVNQKGRRLKDWTPIIVQVLITIGILGAALIALQGVLAQVAAMLAKGTP